MGLKDWIERHPARFGTLAGWYQQGCGLLAVAFTMPLLLNRSLLSAEHSGIWFAFQGFLAAINLTDFGVTQVLSRQVAYSFKRGAEGVAVGADFIETSSGWAGVAELMGAARRLFLWMNVIGAVMVVGCYEVVLPLGKLISHRTPDVTVAWYCLGLATIFALQCKLYQGVLDGLGHVYAGRIVLGTAQILMGSGVIVVLRVKPSLACLAIVTLIAGAGQLLALRWWLLSVARGKLKPESSQRQISLRALWRVALPFGTVNAAAYLVTSIQVPMVGSLLGAAAVAPFFLAQKIGQTFSQFVMQVLYPQLPVFTHELAAGNPAAAARRMNNSFRLVAMLSFLAFAAMFVGSPHLVAWWVGPDRYVTTPVLGLMCTDYAIVAWATVWGHFVLASGTNPFVLSTVLAGVGNLVLCALLIPSYGIAAIPVASLLAGCLTNYWFNPWMGVRLLSRLRAGVSL